MLASAITLVFSNYFTIWQALGITFVVECLCLAENLFATKYDFLHPVFSKSEKGEPDIATPSSNLCSIFAFFVTIILVGLIILYSVFSLLKGNPLNKFIIYVLPSVVSLIILILCVFYFSNKLNKIKGEG